MYYLSYDEKHLFIEWTYEDPLDRSLLAYNLADGTVEIIAQQLESNAVPSPVSDCIILFGTVEGEDPALYGMLGFDHSPKVIDSQGQRYRFELDPEQPKPDSSAVDFAWSPDGLQLAFTVESRSGRHNLYLASVDGSNMKFLFGTEKGYLRVERLAWSPTGEQIAVVARYNGADGGIQKGIFLVQVDSGEGRLVVEKILRSVFWVSNGQSLIFKSYDGCQMLDLGTDETTKVDLTLCNPYARPGTRP